jgi:Rod binding domain-containing protein
MDFEALLIAQMLKLARESGGGMTGDSDEQDETNSTMVELGEQQLAQALSASGGLGLAKMVVAGLTNHANR